MKGARTSLKREEGIRQFSDSTKYQPLGKILPRTEFSIDRYKRRELTTSEC